MQNRGMITPNWQQYVLYLSARFGKHYNDPMVELVGLKQAGTITELHDQFDVIISRLQLQPEYALSCFLAALDDEISNISDI